MDFHRIHLDDQPSASPCQGLARELTGFFGDGSDGGEKHRSIKEHGQIKQRQKHIIGHYLPIFDSYQLFDGSTKLPLIAPNKSYHFLTSL
jgi:hypothetical protein